MGEVVESSLEGVDFGSFSSAISAQSLLHRGHSGDLVDHFEISDARHERTFEVEDGYVSNVTDQERRLVCDVFSCRSPHTRLLGRGDRPLPLRPFRLVSTFGRAGRGFVPVGAQFRVILRACHPRFAPSVLVLAIESTTAFSFGHHIANASASSSVFRASSPSAELIV